MKNTFLAPLPRIFYPSASGIYKLRSMYLDLLIKCSVFTFANRSVFIVRQEGREGERKGIEYLNTVGKRGKKGGRKRHRENKEYVLTKLYLLSCSTQNLK